MMQHDHCRLPSAAHSRRVAPSDYPDTSPPAADPGVKLIPAAGVPIAKALCGQRVDAAGSSFRDAAETAVLTLGTWQGGTALSPA